MHTLSTMCQQCGNSIDLADPRLSIISTIDAGYTFCPDCGEIIILDSSTIRRARVARGELP